MRVLIFHGYLLRGTGSNVYNANLAQALARLGHEVHLLCQDRDAGSLAWVDAVGRWRGGTLEVESAAGAARGEGRDGERTGSISAYLPPIGELLPVYVPDVYEGFRALPFPELSEAELERYLAINARAVREVAERAGGVDAALANHLIMGPAILARAGIHFAAKVHGSALSYTVLPHPRFLPFARAGMSAARAVLVGSRHTATALWGALDDPELPARTRLGPPGVDVRTFAPLADRAQAPELLGELAGRLEVAGVAGLGRDGAAAAVGVRHFAAATGPRVVFVGKLIVAKGCDLLLAAWPLVVRRNPGARLLLVGFGEYRAGLRRLWDALAAGDLEGARRVAAAGRVLEGGEEGALEHLAAFLADPPAGYADAARAAGGSVELAGRLEYDEVATAVRCSDAMVVPSTFPEAFGMVAAEAAATGALPVCAEHSGLAEVAGALAAALPPGIGDLTSFPVGPRAPEAIAARLNDWLGLDGSTRAVARAALAATVRERWSWERVAEGVLAASAGRLDVLPEVPES